MLSDLKRVLGLYSHQSFQGSDAEFQCQSCKEGWRLRGSYVFRQMDCLAHHLMYLASSCPHGSQNQTRTHENQEECRGLGLPSEHTNYREQVKKWSGMFNFLLLFS